MLDPQGTLSLRDGTNNSGTNPTRDGGRARRRENVCGSEELERPSGLLKCWLLLPRSGSRSWGPAGCGPVRVPGEKGPSRSQRG